MSDFHQKLVESLADTAYDEDGWLSDAQNAQLEVEQFGTAVHFCGEGSIDLAHIASIAASLGLAVEE